MEDIWVPDRLLVGEASSGGVINPLAIYNTARQSDNKGRQPGKVERAEANRFFIKGRIRVNLKTLRLPASKQRGPLVRGRLLIIDLRPVIISTEIRRVFAERRRKRTPDFTTGGGRTTPRRQMMRKRGQMGKEEEDSPAEPPAIKEESDFGGNTCERHDEDPVGLPGEPPVQQSHLDDEKGDEELRSEG